MFNISDLKPVGFFKKLLNPCYLKSDVDARVKKFNMRNAEILASSNSQLEATKKTLIARVNDINKLNKVILEFKDRESINNKTILSLNKRLEAVDNVAGKLNDALVKGRANDKDIIRLNRLLNTEKESKAKLVEQIATLEANSKKHAKPTATNHTKRLDRVTVKAIVTANKKGKTSYEISNIHDVSKRTVDSILSGKTYSKVTGIGKKTISSKKKK